MKGILSAIDAKIRVLTRHHIEPRRGRYVMFVHPVQRRAIELRGQLQATDLRRNWKQIVEQITAEFLHG